MIFQLSQTFSLSSALADFIQFFLALAIFDGSTARYDNSPEINPASMRFARNPEAIAAVAAE